MATEVLVPTLGESITEATLGEWLKAPGDAVAVDEPIASLETDKVSVEVPSPVAGTMGAHAVAVGDTVSVGAMLATIDAGGDAPAQAAAPQPAVTQSPASAPAAATPPASSPAEDSGPAALSPSVRRAILEHGVDPATIKGTGKDGRITKEDVEAAASAKPAAQAPAAPAVAGTSDGGQAAAGRAEATPTALLGGEARGARPHDAPASDDRQAPEGRAEHRGDADDVQRRRHDRGHRRARQVQGPVREEARRPPGLHGLLREGRVHGAEGHPSVNASIDGDEIVYHDYADISVAVSSPGGLVVPVIRDADQLSVAGIEKTIGDFGRRAKDGTLKMDEMKGGTFTISNGGVFGSLMSTPIINPPQSAVLGLHRIEDRPVVVDGQVVVRPMMYLALSYDHRLIDGREAVTFLVALKNAIEDPTRILIDL